MKVHVILQNAWSPAYAGRRWPRESWLRALHASRSGQRLGTLRNFAEAGGAGPYQWIYDNTTPAVAATSRGVCPIDWGHVATVLLDRPDVLVLCGDQAAAIANGRPACPVLVIPHPAFMCLTNALLSRAGELLRTGFAGIVRLQQNKGGFTESRGALSVLSIPGK